MDLLEHFSRMAGNSLWSNDRLYRAVLALKPGEFEAARTNFFPSIKETLNHILAVDLLYLDMLEEGGVGASVFDDFAPFHHAAKLAQAQAAFDLRLLDFCSAYRQAISIAASSPTGARTARFPSASATCWRICSSTRSTIAARCMRCWPEHR